MLWYVKHHVERNRQYMMIGLQPSNILCFFGVTYMSLWDIMGAWSDGFRLTVTITDHSPCPPRGMASNETENLSKRKDQRIWCSHPFSNKKHIPIRLT